MKKKHAAVRTALIFLGIMAAVTFFSAQKKRLFCAPENPIIFFAITQEEIRQTTGFAYLFGEYYPFPRQNIFFSDLSF